MTPRQVVGTVMRDGEEFYQQVDSSLPVYVLLRNSEVFLVVEGKNYVWHDDFTIRYQGTADGCNVFVVRDATAEQVLTSTLEVLSFAEHSRRWQERFRTHAAKNPLSGIVRSRTKRTRR